jgi:hypothetical protein
VHSSPVQSHENMSKGFESRNVFLKYLVISKSWVMLDKIPRHIQAKYDNQETFLAYLHTQPPFLIRSLYELPHRRRFWIGMLP